MNRNNRVRQAHRVVATVFVATVAVLAAQGPEWVSYFPLLPLALLVLSGVYLYGRPRFGIRRGSDTAAGRPRTGPTGIRAAHRIAAAGFVIAVLITSVVLAVQGPMWVSYLPLLPLAGLLVSGLVMLGRPRGNGRGRSAGNEAAISTSSPGRAG